MSPLLSQMIPLISQGMGCLTRTFSGLWTLVDLILYMENWLTLPSNSFIENLTASKWASKEIGKNRRLVPNNLF